MTTIQVKRGTSSELQTYGNLGLGELGYTTDSRQVFIGTGVNNKLISGLQIVPIDNTDSPYSASVNQALYTNTANGSVTILLPAVATIGDVISVIDTTGNFATNNVIIDRNSHNINGEADNFLLDLNFTETQFVYINVVTGWLIKPGGIGAFAKSDGLDCGSFV